MSNYIPNTVRDSDGHYLIPTITSAEALEGLVFIKTKAGVIKYPNARAINASIGRVAREEGMFDDKLRKTPQKRLGVGESRLTGENTLLCLHAVKNYRFDPFKAASAIEALDRGYHTVRQVVEPVVATPPVVEPGPAVFEEESSDESPITLADIEAALDEVAQMIADYKSSNDGMSGSLQPAA